MSDSLEISLDGSPLERAAQGVKSTLQDLQRALAAIDNLPANKLKASLRGITTLMAEVVADTDKTMDLLVKQAGAAGAKAGAAHAKGVRAGAKAGAEALLEETQQVSKRVKAEIVGMYSPYNARTVVASELKGIEGATTATWKSIYRHRRKLAEDADKAQAQALNNDLAGWRQMLKLKVAAESSTQAELSARQKKALQDDLSGWQHMLKLRVAAKLNATAEEEAANKRALTRDLEGWQHMLKLRVAAEARAAAESRALAVSSLTNASKSMWAAKAAREAADVRQYESNLDVLNARIKKAHKDRADQLSASLETLGRLSKTMWKEKAEKEALDAEAYVRKLDVINARVKAAQARQAEALEAAAYVAGRRAKAMINQAMAEPTGAYSTLQSGAKFGTVVMPKAQDSEPQAHAMTKVRLAVEAVTAAMGRNGEAHTRLQAGLAGTAGLGRQTAGVFDSLGVSANTAHSAARGLASGFNLLWLTWGQVLPLLSGAGVSFGVRKVFDVGSEVEYSIKYLEQVGNLTKEQGEVIRAELRSINAQSEFTLTNLSEGMVNIVKAGMSVEEATRMLKPSADLATSLRTTIDESSKAIIQVMGVFGKEASEASTIASQLYKTANAAPIELSDLVQSFKMSAESSVKFGQSMEDTMAIMAGLGNLQIKGGLAGTAYRNMLIDLFGRTEKSEKALKKLEQQTGVTIKRFDESHKMRRAVDIFDDLNAALVKLTPEAKQEFLQTFFSERGYRGIVDLMAKGSGETRRFAEELRNLDANLASKQAATMMDTTLGMLRQVQANLTNTMDKVFVLQEGAFKALLTSVRDGLASPEFAMLLNTVVSGAISLGRAIESNISLILTLGAGWAAFKAATLGGAVLAALAGHAVTLAGSVGSAVLAVRLLAAGSGGATLALGMLQTRAVQAGAAALGFSASMVASAGAARTAAMAIGIATGPVGWLITALGVLGTMWYTSSSKGKEASDSLTDTIVKNGVINVKALDEEIKKLRERDALLGKSTNPGQEAYSAALAARNATAGALRHTYTMLQDPNLSAQDRKDQEGMRTDLGARLLEQDRALAKARGILAEDERLRTEQADKAAALARRRQDEALAAATSGLQGLNLDRDKGNGGVENRIASLNDAVKNGIGSITEQYNTLGQVAKAEYDNQIKLLEARHSAGLTSEGAYLAEMAYLTSSSEAKRVKIAQDSIQDTFAEMLRVEEAYKRAAEGELARAKGNGKDSASYRAAVEKNLQEKLRALREQGTAAFLKDAAEIEKITADTAQRRVLAEIKAQGEILKIRQETADYWKDNERDLAKDDAAYQLQQRFKDVGEDSPAFLKAEKAAAEAAAQAAEKHASQLLKLEKALQDANKAKEDFLVESAWQDAMWGTDTTAEQMDGAQRLAEYARQLEEELAQFKIRLGEDVAARSATAYGRAMEAEIDRLKRGVSDSIVTALFEGGQAGKKKLRDLLVAELKKPVTMVVNVLVNSLMSSLLGSGTASAATSAAGGASGAVSLAQMASNAYSAITSSTWFSNFGGSVTNLINQAGGKLFNAGLEQLGGTLIDFSNTYASQITQFANVAGNALAAFQGLKSLADGNYGGAAGSAIGYYFGGPIGAAIGNFIGSSLNEALFGSAGTLHTGGAGSYSTAQGAKFGIYDAQLGFGADAYNAQTASASAEIAKSAVLALEGMSAMFGQNSKFWVGTGYADDTSKDGAWGALKVVKDGATILDWGRGVDKWPGREFANGSAGQTQYLQAVAAELKNILKGAAPAWADEILDAIEGTVTLEKLGTAMAEIQRVHAALASLANAMPQLANLTDSATSNLLGLAGGIDNLQSLAGAYYQSFYSDTEKLAAKQSDMQKVFQALGEAMPTTRAGFRDLVEAQDLTTESGQRMYMALLNLAPAFSEITSEVGNSAKSIMDYVNQLKGERAGLATPTQQLAFARETYVGDLSKARGGDAEAMSRITDSAGAYIEAQKVVTASSSYTQAVIDQIIAELTALASGQPLPQFAKGGYHKGGWAVVGERGPELAYFNAPARIYNANQSASMMNNDAMVAELRALRAEVAMLRDQQSAETRALISSNFAAQEASADAIVSGVADAGERQVWSLQTQPVIK